MQGPKTGDIATKTGDTAQKKQVILRQKNRRSCEKTDNNTTNKAPAIKNIQYATKISNIVTKTHAILY